MTATLAAPHEIKVYHRSAKTGGSDNWTTPDDIYEDLVDWLIKKEQATCSRNPTPTTQPNGVPAPGKVSRTS